MGKKSKKQKIEKNDINKNLEVREREVIELKEKLNNLGLNENFEGVEKFYKILDSYEREGVDLSGKIKIPGIKRCINYNLFNSCNKLNKVVLEYNNNI